MRPPPTQPGKKQMTKSRHREKIVPPGTIMQFDGSDEQAGLWGFLTSR
jgi:hypothetical protein